ncbi:hypothetical protein BD779DRAFT_1593722 [Infundibulicybe gibba]|nr:hypothetical protein BD779DRAFT_1593722 [Infundibulicybe gibba]
MDAGMAMGTIFPRDYFTLDIFVFNQSTWTRRFEVSWPDARHSRGQGAGGGGNPGVISLDNRVRVGPLRPSRASRPGVHSIDTLTLTDIESGFSMNLRSVMDVVVHDPTA